MGQKMTAESGKELCTTGEQGTAMYVIHDGHVELRSGKENVIVLGPGDSFCEEVISGLSETCDYTAIAVDRVRLYMITEDGFADVFRSMPNVRIQALSNAKDIRKGRQRLIGG